MADQLAAAGYDVTVTTRTQPVADHRWHPLDLADRTSVATFAQWYDDQGAELDLLVNCAGIHLDLGSRWKEPQLLDGHEIHWRTNYLGTVDLTRALLPRLLAATDARGTAGVLHVVSKLHERGVAAALVDEDWDYDSWVAYGSSKLALVHDAAGLAAEHGTRGLRAIAMHPGAVSTNIADRGLETRPLLRRLRNLARPLERRTLMRPTESAELLVRLATDPAIASGYFHKSRPADPAPLADDLDLRARLQAATDEWLASDQ